MSEKRSLSLKSWLTAGLIISLCLVNFFLIKQNLDLRKRLAAGGRTIDITTNSLKSGDVVRSLAGTDLDGQPYELEFKKDRRQHLLLFFSPHCPYCVQQAPLWRALLDKVDSSRVAVVGVVSDEEDRKLVASHVEEAGYSKTRTPLPVVFFSNQALGSYKLMATPTTLLINDEGKVERSWVGKWDEAKATEVAAALAPQN